MPVFLKENSQKVHYIHKYTYGNAYCREINGKSYIKGGRWFCVYNIHKTDIHYQYGSGGLSFLQWVEEHQAIAQLPAGFFCS